MGRPRKADAPDLRAAHELTAGLIERLTCRTDVKAQAFLRDSKAPGLRVRVTNTGNKSYVFEGKLNRQTIRRTIGDVRAWSIDQARQEARRLSVMLDAGVDPREHARKQLADKEAQKATELAKAEAVKAQAVTAAEAWVMYIEERRPNWGVRHYQDHLRLSAAGGKELRNRRSGQTIAGPLSPLLAMPLRDLDPQTIEAWAKEQAKTRPTQARLAWRCLKTFLSWCAEHQQFAPLLPAVNPAKTKKAREALGKPGVKRDALMREQLAAWFDGVSKLSNPAVSAYLITVLLTGARPGEVLTLRWSDLNARWKGVTIRDKVEGERVIPLTPYVSHLLHALPRRNDWVFSSPRTDKHLTRLDPMHATACRVGGIEGLTLHGLRRSFKSLTEWLEIPAGVVAQIMGHKPSATAEKHYTVRPLDLLRIHHERIESWILEQAGVSFVTDVEPGKLALVTG